MFSKFKNVIKIFKCKFFHCLLIVFIGILVKITVFIPHTVHGNSLFGSQVVSENLKGTQVIADIVSSQILPDIGSISPAGVDVGFQNIELIGKSISKFGSGFIKVLSVDEAGRKIIADVSSKDGSNDAKTASDKRQFIGSKIHYWLIVLSGGFIGLIIGCSIVILFFIFTQRLNSPAANTAGH